MDSISHKTANPILERRLNTIETSRHSRKMRAIGFEVEEMMKLFLIIIIGLAVVILVIGASGGISSLLTEFCAKNPGICGANIPAKDYNSARTSVNALVAATNCVANPSACACINKLCVFFPEEIKKAGFTGFQIKSDVTQSRDVTVECKSATNSLDCTVKNFNLPESFGNGIFKEPKEHIEGFGDPSFLVYFQNFPKGEDASWVGFSSWYKGVGTIMFLSMCASDFLRPALKGLKLLRPTKFAEAMKGLPHTASEIKAEIAKEIKYVESVGQRSINTKTYKMVGEDEASKFYEKIYVVPGPETYTAREFSASNLMQALKDDVKTWAKENWKPAMAKAMAYAVIDGEYAYAAARLDSEVGKIVYDNPQSIVLQVPFKKGEPYPISNLKTIDKETGIDLGMPVIRDKKTTMSLASPCHADIAIKKSEIKCGSYSYSSNGNIECTDITDAGKDDPVCGFSNPGSINVQAFEAITNLVKSKDRRVFQYDGNTLTRIYAPLFGSDKFFENINQDEMDCVDARSFITGNKPVTISPDLSSKIKASFEQNEGQNTELCWFNLLHISEANKRIRDSLKIGQTSFDVLFVKSEGKYIAEILYPISPGMSQYAITLRDSNLDGNWNSLILDMTPWLGDSRIVRGYLYTFDDTNSDGTIDGFTSVNCKIPAIEMNVDGKNYAGDKYNFCYGKESWTGTALTLASFGVDALAKRVPHPLVWIAGTAADCLLAYAELSIQSNWPAGGIK
jgi:hypothetical protein